MVQALKVALEAALATATYRDLDAAFLRELQLQGWEARREAKIVEHRRFKDDARVSAGRDEISIEIEKDGNRLEFDLLKMMAFSYTVIPSRRAFGCLIVPADHKLKNPYISGNAHELTWDYLTRRLLPMIKNLQGINLKNVLVLGYPQSTTFKGKVQSSASTLLRHKQKKIRSSEINSLRGQIILGWERAGKPQWGLDTTVKMAVQADKTLEARNLNPAPKFRSNRLKNNNAYSRKWVLACKFEWLKSRR